MGILPGDPDPDKLFMTVEKLLELITQKVKLRRPRIAAMLAVRRLLCHSTGIDQLDLSRSVLGQWCLQSLRSSLRDLRVAAG